MDPGRVGELSERQAECLRLLGRGMSAKAIAGELDLSYETVNAHLKAARRILKVGRSLDAARLLAQTERFESQETVGNHEMGMVGRALETASRHSQMSGAASDAANVVRENRIAFDGGEATLRGPTRNANGRRLDDLTPTRRTAAIILAMIACVIVIAGMAAIASSLQSILWSIASLH